MTWSLMLLMISGKVFLLSGIPSEAECKELAYHALTVKGTFVEEAKCYSEEGEIMKKQLEKET